MARRRRFPFRPPRPMPRKNLEWIGFRDGGVSANLDTTANFELVPPASADGVVIADITVLRVVGQICISNQGAVTTNAAVGMMLGVRSVGKDQTIDEVYTPLGTDVDELDNGVMWQWVASTPGPGVAAGDLDLVSLIIPVDITVKRRVEKRDSLVLTATASTSGRKELSVNLRCLIKHF